MPERKLIEIAEHAGYCYGVERALRLTREASSTLIEDAIHTLGPIIHNPSVVKELEEQGVKAVSSLANVESGTVIIRSHGVEPEILAYAEEKGLNIVDATCPFVKKAQKCAKKLAEEGYRVVIVGEEDHPEVKGIRAYAGKDAVVIEGPGKLEGIELGDKVGVVVQTTQPASVLQKVIDRIIPIASEMKVYNTICGATHLRQEGSKRLAQRTDMIIVVGGRNSANTSRLVTICRDEGAFVHHIETEDELEQEWFRGISKIGITGGASTPEYQIKRVFNRVRDIVSAG